MPKMVTKTINITTVKYSLIKVVDGVPTFEEQPLAVFTGVYNEKRVKAAMKKLLGADTQYVIVDFQAGRKTYGMSLEEFIRGAHELTDEERAVADSGDDEEQDSGGEDAAADDGRVEDHSAF